MKVVLVDFAVEGYTLYPYGLFALKAYLVQEGAAFDVQILRLSSSDPVETAVHSIEACGGDVVGLSCFVWNESIVHDVAKSLRAQRPNLLIYVGGPQVEAGDPRLQALLTDRTLNAAVVGEGEEPLHALLTAALNGRPAGEVPGCGICDSQGVKWIPAGHPTKVVELPNPCELDEVRELVATTGIAMYESSRGCPYLCTFCDQGAKQFRSRALDVIESDLAFILSMKPRKLVFLDSTFNVSRSRTARILDCIIESGVQVEIEAEIKPERCEQDIVQLMKRAGVTAVEIGLQSSKQDTLTYIKRKNDLGRIKESVRWFEEAGIRVFVDTIIGLPGESLGDWLDTVDCCFALGDVTIFSNVLKILPNAEMKSDVGRFKIEYVRESEGAITATSAMSSDDIQLAKLHQKMIKHLWNRAQHKSALRDLIKARYRGRLTAFTAEAIRVLARGRVPEDQLKTERFWVTHTPEETTAISRRTPRRVIQINRID